MPRTLRSRRPSPAMVVASIALIVALGGTGYAAIKLPANSVGTKQLKKDAVTGSKVKDFSLFANDFAAGQVPKGPAGPAGAAGAAGPTGPAGAQGAAGAAGASGVADATVLAEAGQLPRIFTFAKKRGDTDLLITFSGSGYRNPAGGPGTISLELDGTVIATSTLYFNTASQHQALPTGSKVVTSSAAGPHIVKVLAGSSLLTDGGDLFTVTVLEFKPSG